jgi:integrase
MDSDVTFDVRVYRTEIYKGAKVTTYKVRWKVGTRLFKTPFRNAAQADSFRSSLLMAARRGESFSLETGRPLSWMRGEPQKSWFDLVLGYSAAKWPYAAPNHRRSIAEALTDATEVMLTDGTGPWTRDQIRTVLRTWAFSGRMRGQDEPQGDLALLVSWLRTATVPMTELATPGSGPARARALLERVSQKMDGTAAAANTANRKRAVLSNLMLYAVETGELPANPLKQVRWNRPRTLRTVDPRTVVSTDQAQRLLTAVGRQGELGKRMVAFFACIYYAALRPEEAVDLRVSNLVSLPADDWGEMILTNADPRTGSHWTDHGQPRQRRELKHRATGETRTVPIHPALAVLLIAHQASYPPGPGERIFTGPRGGIFTDRAYLRIFHKARADAFTEAETASLLARRPYDLRHAAVSTWLNAGVPAPQVAEWAGHSVDVLLRVYAKCVTGQQEDAKRRIEAATRPSATGR